MEPISITRSIGRGSQTLPSAKVTGYSLESINVNQLKTVTINNKHEYYARCPKHDKCAGHICKTTNGALMMPQKFASMVGSIENEYGRFASRLISADTARGYEDYKQAIRGTMMSKDGVIRNDMMGGTVDGSIRMVIVPCWQLQRNEIAIPRKVASKVRYPCVKTITIKKTEYLADTYSNRCITEGDYALVVRPPSLWHGNTQPMKIVLWDEPSIGLCPLNCAEYHADFDGDEIQVYPLYTEEAINEAIEWLNNVDRTDPMTAMAGDIPNYDARDDTHRSTYMKHTTLSMLQIQDETPINGLGKISRMKADTAAMTATMMNTTTDIGDFYTESLRGIGDVMAQQLTQGGIGKTFRHARVGASCFSLQDNGELDILTSSGVTRIHGLATEAHAKGMPTLTAINKLVSTAQQAALDSHRAKVADISRFDVVKSIVEGSDEILVVLRSLGRTRTKWSMYYDGVYVAIAHDASSIYADDVIGCYHPSVLFQVGDRSFEVCHAGLEFACRYTKIELTPEELIATTVMLCHEPSKHARPVLTRIGLNNRNTRWFCQMVGMHYGRISDAIGSGAAKRVLGIDSLAECLAFYNFDGLHHQ